MVRPQLDGGSRTKLPPGPTGIPVIGRQIAFVRDPLGFLTRAHRDYGDMVSLPLNGRTVVAAFGPDQVDAATDAYGKQVDISMVGGLNISIGKDNLQGRGPLNTTGTE